MVSVYAPQGEKCLSTPSSPHSAEGPRQCSWVTAGSRNSALVLRVQPSFADLAALVTNREPVISFSAVISPPPVYRFVLSGPPFSHLFKGKCELS